MRTPVFRSFPRFLTFAASLVLTLLLAPAIAAQTQITTGVIRGTVVDANEASVPGANVEIKNVDTGDTKSLTSDEDGRFVALQLQPGKYSVTISKQGFA
ncbi:MAG TPA: carboxypeptidase-like regulatory domain-containing protein, partial [Pyrinomonadaceae bacterium]